MRWIVASKWGADRQEDRPHDSQGNMMNVGMSKSSNKQKGKIRSKPR